MADAQLSQDDVKAAHPDGDAAFQQLVSEHHALDEAVRELSSYGYLTHDQQLREAALKKRKLVLKDRIAAMVREEPRLAGFA
jgi:uncharacterized protein YdcH (DUF465 family)